METNETENCLKNNEVYEAIFIIIHLLLVGSQFIAISLTI